MRLHRLRSFAVLSLVSLAAAVRAPRLEAVEPKPPRADFSGSWQLEERLRTDSVSKLKVGEVPAGATTGATGAPAGGGGGRQGGTGGGEVDVPFELMEDDRRLTVTDDGRKVRVTTSGGRQRTLFTDGEAREVDDENGPAKVRVRRKGPAGEKIVISTQWHGGREREETWELLSSPRRVVVTATVHAPRPHTYSRTYVPATELPVAPAAAAPQRAAVPSPEPPATPSGDVPTPAPVAISRAPMKECAIRPPRRTEEAELARMARLSGREAEARALAAVAPRKPSGVISGEPEVREGCLVYTFFLRLPGGKEAEEIVVDAGDGKLLAAEKD